jgi:DNA-binding transcriptional MerR regulator
VIGANAKLLKIGELAQRTGKSVRAIRFYEELGLIQSAAHTKGGFRLFTEDDARRVLLVDKFHQLGFSLEEIAQIVKAYRSSGTGDEAHRKLTPLLKMTLQAINEKISLLEGFRREVENSISFVDDCVRCDAQPAQVRCTTCNRGHHQVGSVPFFVDTLL